MREHLGWCDAKHFRSAVAVGITKAAVASRELPATVSFVRERSGNAPKHHVIHDLYCFTFDDYVQARIPRITTGRQNHMREFVCRFENFCSPVPVENQSASSARAATTGVTCGRPSVNSVERRHRLRHRILSFSASTACIITSDYEWPFRSAWSGEAVTSLTGADLGTGPALLSLPSGQLLGAIFVVTPLNSFPSLRMMLTCGGKGSQRAWLWPRS